MTHAEWLAEGTRRFGPDQMKWRFVCPVCRHVASVEDWKTAGASESEVAFSCIGRHIAGAREALGDKTKPGPCNYAGGGLFKLNPVKVEFDDGSTGTVFDFGPPNEIGAGQIWARANGTTFTIDKIDEKYAYYWLAAGSRPQYRSIRLDLLLKKYKCVTPV